MIEFRKSFCIASVEALLVLLKCPSNSFFVGDRHMDGEEIEAELTLEELNNAIADGALWSAQPIPVELPKPCPFCGAELSSLSSRSFHIIHNDGCSTWRALGGLCLKPLEDIEQWNKRSK